MNNLERIKEHLAPEVFDQFMENVAAHNKFAVSPEDFVNILPTPYAGLVLKTSFPWRDTPQGYDYWLGVYESLPPVPEDEPFEEVLRGLL